MYKIIGSDQKTYGPVPAEQLRQWITEGRVTSATLVQGEASAEWKPLSSFPEFAPPPGPATPPTLSVPPPSRQPAPQETNSMATTGFVFGLISLVPCCCFSPIFAILGIVFSSIALNRAGRYPNENGKSLAIAGLILSVIGLGVGTLLGLYGLFANHHGFNYNWQHHW